MTRSRVTEHQRLAHGWHAQLLAAAELVTCQIEAEPRRETVPGVTLEPLPFAHHIGDEDLTAEVQANQRRRRIALTP